MKIIDSNTRAGRDISISRAFVVCRAARNIARESLGAEQEQALFEQALSVTISQLEALAADSDIFEAHLEIAGDSMIADGVTEHISEGMCAPSAVQTTCEEVVAMFADIDDEYLRARTDDVRDIFARILDNLSGGALNPFAELQSGDIVVAEELFPSDLALIDLDSIGGFVTAQGSATSHICIMARNHNLAVVVGIGQQLSSIATGDTIIVDSGAGRVVVNPDAQTLEHYKTRLAELAEECRAEQDVAFETITKGDKRLYVMANAGSVADVEQAIASGADGVGLFRSEFLYMQSASAPTEQQQYEAYRDAALACKGKPLTIRTLDIGGDKALPYMNFEAEENPFLGWRAIRVCLELKELFATQLRAILRASGHSGTDVRIMFPMIATLDELQQAVALLEQCKAELDAQGVSYDRDIKVGIMVETPAAALCIEDFYEVSDFFSIGSNDLTQYVLAADRTADFSKDFTDPHHRSVIGLVDSVIEKCTKMKKWIGICGELASDPILVPHFIEKGVSELSVSPSLILKTRAVIRGENI